MNVGSEEKNLEEIVGHICDYILQMVSSKGEQAAQLRYQVGLLRFNGVQYIVDDVFGTNLLGVFNTARTLPITSDLVAMVRQQIYNEKPMGPVATIVVETAILYCLTTESVLITQRTFKSRDEVLVVMKLMKAAFDSAREQAADRMDSSTYQNVSYLAGSLINHLNSQALKLPSIVKFSYQATLPSLFLGNLIYQDTTRSDELVDENNAVHPLFMPLEIIGLRA